MALLVTGCTAALGAGDPIDKSGYHLFDPTPREYMRELSTDRPDQTESPYTVDAGHFQVEIDIVNATFDRDHSGGGDRRTTDYAVSTLNLKAGLSNNVDIQFVLGTYLHSRVDDLMVGTVTTASGFGDIQTRLKINFWGNDGGKTAFGMMPFVKWPLSQSDLRNGDLEGGVIFPFGMDLGGGWGMGAQTEFDFVSNGEGDYDVEYFNTITFGHGIVGNLDGYVEFAALFTANTESDWQGRVSLGFTYALNVDAQLDWGCNFGVTATAPDFNPFIGFTYRY